MGFFDKLEEFVNGYQRGKAFGDVTRILQKDGASARAELSQMARNCSRAELVQLDEALIHASQHAWTGSLRDRAAELHGYLCQICC